MRTGTSTAMWAAGALVILVCFALVGFGCAGGSAGRVSTTTGPAGGLGPEATARPTTSAVTVTTGEDDPGGEPIKIGAPLPLTGVYALDGDDMQSGLELAVADLNLDGGLLGRPVELRYFDTEEMTAETLEASKAYLVDQEKVDLVVEAYGGYGPDFEAYGAESQVPFIHASGSAAAAELVKADPERYGNMFQVAPIEVEYGRRAWEGIAGFQDRYVYPNTKLAIVHGDEEWDRKYAAGVAARAAQDGWQVAVDQEVAYGTSDWASILAMIRSAQPAAIVCSYRSVDGLASFVQQFMEAPTPSLLDISFLVTLPEIQEALGERLNGVMGYVSAYLPPGADGDAWRERYEETYGTKVPLTNPPSAYDSVMLWAEAVRAVGDPTKYGAIVDRIRNHPYRGLLGTYDFGDPGQTVRSGPDLPIAYAQYAGDGRLVFSGTDPFAFPSYIQPAWPQRQEPPATAQSR